ncbi:MAG TPA: DMT family transporter [Burkholderiales bacterium]|jgi:drug/metabolite transporter (DMT)-like permease|nr:DMT family transporter [Burkholderiales bacterium]
MPLEVTLAVLGAALAHATWNAMIKSSRDVLLDLTLVTFLAGLAAAPLLLFVVPPARESWPYIAASVFTHIAYYIALVGAYRAGDLSHGYPIMRGLAPLIVSLCALAWLGEAPTPTVWAGVLLICSGVLSLGLVGFHWRESRVSSRWAFANAVIIAIYTLIDATGVRASGSPAGYVLWLFVLDALPFPFMVFMSRGTQLLSYARRFWLRGLVGGVLSAGAYGVALWAMTRAPVAAVAALRETSVIFAALIGAWLLKEGHIARRVAGAVTVAAGVVALKI